MTSIEHVEIEWSEEGPPDPGHAGMPSWDSRLEAIKERPGVWAKFGPYQNSSITRTVRNAAERVGGEFEYTTRKREDEQYDVWVRFLKGE